MLGASWQVHAETFDCRMLHGGSSVVEIKEPLFFGSPEVNIKLIPSGKRIKATVVDYGDGWVTFDDGYGYYGEGKNVCDSIVNENYGKSGRHCGALRKYFKYDSSGDANGQLLVKEFTTKSCMLRCTYHSAGEYAAAGMCTR